MDLGEIFSNVEKKMQADIGKARASITHSGLKGSQFERTFRTFLREYLPCSLEISTGQVVDSRGGISKQLDVIISDSARTPVLYQDEETRVVPVECVYAVIEVKANLSIGEVESVFENMRSVKALTKTAYEPPQGLIHSKVRMYGQPWDIWPVNYYAFSFEGADLRSVAQRLDQLTIAAKSPIHHRVDMVCVLDRGVVCNQRTDGVFDALPSPGSSLFVCNTRKPLLLFYALASHYFNQCVLPPFRFSTYLGQMEFD